MSQFKKINAGALQWRLKNFWSGFKHIKVCVNSLIFFIFVKCSLVILHYI